MIYWPENEEVQIAFLFIDLLQLSTASFPAQSFGKKQGKKTSRRHYSKLAQPQNLEKERKLNVLLNIILDLEGLSGASLYFLAG